MERSSASREVRLPAGSTAADGAGGEPASRSGAQGTGLSMKTPGSDAAFLQPLADVVVGLRLEEDRAVLSVAGEIDLGTVGRLDAALASVEPLRLPTVVLDMSEVDFIDSSGLHRLVIALKRQREHGGDLVVRAPSPQVLRVLDIVGLTQLLRIEPERDQISSP